MVQVSEKTASVQAAAAEFYRALNAIFKGDVQPMTEIWSHAEDVTYLGPQGEILIGWNQVLKCWKEQASLNLGGKITPDKMHIIANKDIGIIQNYENGTNIINGKAKTVKIRATNLFRKENGEWKMLSHQTDLLPHLMKNV